MGFSDLPRIAHARGGVVLLSEAPRVGLTVAELRRRATADGWDEPFPGAVLLPGATADARALTAAAALACGGAASRASALWLHGVLDHPPRRPQVLVPYGRRGIAMARAEVTRTRVLPPEHLVEIRGVAATSIARSLLDLGRATSPGRLARLVVEAEARTRFDREDLRRCRAGVGRGYEGVGVVDAALEGLGHLRSDSGWEHEVRADLTARGLPVHPEPFPWRCEDGVVVHLDLAFPAHWVVGECDGRAHHTSRRAFATDRVRWTQVVRSWRPVWITWHRWRDDRPAVLADVHRALELADTSRPPAVPSA